jgi:hypothetical protein
MKIFDFKNPRHIEILREELQRAKQIMSNSNSRSLTEMSSEFDATPKLDPFIVANWMESNRDLLQGYTFSSGGASKQVLDIIEWLRRGSASQFYIQSLIDDMDKLDGVAIDDHEFYKKSETAMQPSSSKNKLNPYEMPGGQPSRGYMGGSWTGD